MILFIINVFIMIMIIIIMIVITYIILMLFVDQFLMFMLRSRDGTYLSLSSQDGFCSIVTFAPGELGVVSDVPLPVAGEHISYEPCNYPRVSSH